MTTCSGASCRNVVSLGEGENASAQLNSARFFSSPSGSAGFFSVPPGGALRRLASLHVRHLMRGPMGRNMTPPFLFASVINGGHTRRVFLQMRSWEETEGRSGNGGRGAVREPRGEP